VPSSFDLPLLIVAAGSRNLERRESTKLAVFMGYDAGLPHTDVSICASRSREKLLSRRIHIAVKNAEHKDLEERQGKGL